MTIEWTPGRRALLVITGTDTHPFDRLCRWADEWSETHPDDDVVVQYGFSTAPSVARSVKIMAPTDLSAALNGADVVITHGGPGTISTVRSAGLFPVILARDPARGEHVDEHQLRFAQWARGRELGIVVESTTDLESAIERAAAQDGGTAQPNAQIAGSVASLGDQLRILKRGSRLRRSFPLLRKPRWRDAP